VLFPEPLAPITLRTTPAGYGEADTAKHFIGAEGLAQISALQDRPRLQHGWSILSFIPVVSSITGVAP